MSQRFLRALAGAAFFLGLAGPAGAVQVLTTSPINVDNPGYDLFCDATNAGTSPVTITTQFVDFQGNVTESFGPQLLGPGDGSSHEASQGNLTFYCRIIVDAGSAKNVRAAAIVASNNRYLTSAEAR